MGIVSEVIQDMPTVNHSGVKKLIRSTTLELAMISVNAFRHRLFEVQYLIKQRANLHQVLLELLGVGLPVAKADTERIKKCSQNKLVFFAQDCRDWAFGQDVAERRHCRVLTIIGA